MISMQKKIHSGIRYVLAAVLVFTLAFHVRSKAVETLPRDSDEGTYLAAGVEFAQIFRSGDLFGLTQTNANPEHPPLNKIGFGLAMLPLLGDAPPEDQFAAVNEPIGKAARQFSAVFGALAAALLALVNPFAGIMLALHTMTVKYTSEIMLEALPLFTSLAAVLAYLRFKYNTPDAP